MRLRVFAAMLLFCLLFSACASGKPEAEPLNVYYCAADGGMKSGSAIIQTVCPVGAGRDRLHEALRLLTEEPEEEGMRSAFPAHIRIEAYSLEDGNMAVSLTEGYLNLPPLQQTRIRACLVLTLCGLEEVERVDLYEDGRLLEPGLTSRIFLSESLPEGTDDTELRFWRPDPENACLVSEWQTVRLRENTTAPEAVLRRLLPTLYDYGFPRETELLSVSRREGVCTVDFSAAFQETAELGPTALRLLLYAIVNTLTELDSVDAVQLRCEGSALGVMGGMELNGSFLHEEAFSAERMAGEGYLPVTFYFSAANGMLVPVRAAIPAVPGMTAAETAVRALLEPESGWGLQSSAFYGTELLGFTEENGVAELLLSEAFWNGPESLRELTASALAATAADAGKTDGIRIVTASGAYRDGEILRKNGEWIADG